LTPAEYTVLAILFPYLAAHLVLYFGLLSNLKPSNLQYCPFISVIVAARNEEENINRCLASLVNLDYPADKFEIIVVDDNSTDRTADIIKSLASQNSLIKFFQPSGTISYLKGKANALAQAIKISKGEIIFTTDADCIVNPLWLKEMVRYYDEKTGIVCGYSVVEPRNLFWGIQSFDWMYLLSLASGSAALGDQLSCVGNNMSYRRAAYDEVGGYQNVKFSVTEDFMLLQTIKRKTKWKTKFPLNANIFNRTLPCLSFMELYRQKKRWGTGGLDINWLGYLVGFIGWAIGAAVLFSLMFIGWLPYLFLIAGKCVADFFFILPVVTRSKIYKVYLYLIPFEIYFVVYAFLLPFIVAFDRTVVWKEQEFKSQTSNLKS
jgi:cellulose synthase/poly-beta-1,6-N-acetylglucosamine synthase-like glycosyltransferase